MEDSNQNNSLSKYTRVIKYAWMAALTLMLIIPFIFLFEELNSPSLCCPNEIITLLYKLLGYSVLSIVASILLLFVIVPII